MLGIFVMMVGMTGIVGNAVVCSIVVVISVVGKRDGVRDGCLVLQIGQVPLSAWWVLNSEQMIRDDDERRVFYSYDERRYYDV